MQGAYYQEAMGVANPNPNPNPRGMYRKVGEYQGTYGSGYKVLGECRGLQRNARGTKGSGYKVPGKGRGMQGNARGTWE